MFLNLTEQWITFFLYHFTNLLIFIGWVCNCFPPSINTDHLLTFWGFLQNILTFVINIVTIISFIHIYLLFRWIQCLPLIHSCHSFIPSSVSFKFIMNMDNWYLLLLSHLFKKMYLFMFASINNNLILYVWHYCLPN